MRPPGPPPPPPPYQRPTPASPPPPDQACPYPEPCPWHPRTIGPSDRPAHAQSRDRAAPIESAPDAEESAVERVARAIHEADDRGCGPWTACPAQDDYRGLAQAALAAMRGPESPVVAAMLALAEEFDRNGHSRRPQDAAAGSWYGAADAIRAVLAAALRPDAAAPEVQR